MTLEEFLETSYKVINGEISSFSSLKSFIASRKFKVSKKEVDLLFELIKRIYWGIFSDLNFEDYKELWKTFVIPDPNYKSVYGDLKRNIIVSNIYIALLDIHGYTTFCQKTRKNINSLYRLDRFVEDIIKTTTKKHGVISRRERGDEIILIGVDAVDIVNATFEVINLFSKNIRFSNDDKDSDEYFLPPFEISGGIVGGYSTTPLIIGVNGDLQGILINLAARLQARANTISPNKTKIVVDYNTYYKFISSNKPKTKFTESIKFLFNGDIEFKGGKLKVYEIYFREDEKYKDLISKHISNLVDSIKKGEWQSNVISNLCNLGMVVSENITPFSKEIEIFQDNEIKKIEVSNDFISSIFLNIKYSAINSRNFHNMIHRLGFLVEILDKLEEFDQIVKEYCKSVYREYLKIFNEYNKIFLEVISQNPSTFMSPSEMEIFLNFESYKSSYEEVINRLFSDTKFSDKRSIIWNRAYNIVKPSISFSIYTGKK
ncbi:MAG: hypothetical protein ACPL4C_03730 [Brevinematia bacterium]